ncbi:MAG TPA: PSD1 and planctomycete cytochrome C domain-containing protein, partial [Pirellulales bacterium]|nr:PSD1 and planctomycete cytochrome C domain-containing protein [Pirellulales bacterium]
WPLRAGEPDSRGLEFFEQNVRPLLAQRCYKCHSAKADPLRGGLLLDSRSGWQRGGDSGPAIVPGDPDASLVVKAVRYDDDQVQMPPDGKLSEREIASLVEWIKLGAPDPREGEAALVARKFVSLEEGRTRWTFQPMSAADPPQMTASNGATANWCRTPVDRFILARLEEKGISPNAEVDRHRLVRRAYFDLLGLPPSPDEIDAFVNDDSSDAYETLIDRLLDSPHYGERWGRHWLDLVRFAESHGFEHDYDRPSAFHYRDFVIQALNQDLPYDTFVRWQIAGDEIEPDHPLALMATGFLAAGVHSTQITKNQVEKERYDELDDMLATIGTSMLGLSLGCARCHDHKFDPIPTHDYYRLLSTFTTAVRSEVDLDLEAEAYQKDRLAFDRRHAPLAEALARFEREQLPGRLDAWLANLPPQTAQPQTAQPRWTLLDVVRHESKGGAMFTRLADGSLLAGGTNAEHDQYTFVVHTHRRQITAFRLEALAHESFVQGGPGRAANGNFALTDLSITAAPLDGRGDAVPVKLVNPKATFEQAGLPVAAAVDGDSASAWAVDPEFGKDHAAVFEAETPVGFEGGTKLTFTLKFDTNTGHSIGRPNLSLTTAPVPAELDGDSGPQNLDEIAAILARTDGKPTADDKVALLAWYRSLDDDWKTLNQAVEQHLVKMPTPKLTKVLITTEGLPAVRLHTQGGDFLDATHFLERGDPNRKLGVATQGFLQILTSPTSCGVSDAPELRWHVDPPPGWRTSYRRRSLAGWITDFDDGAGQLLARVIVNRLWQHHLGRGIVATPSDFGAQGEPPTHPELLDWLARRLIAGGWRLKPIHKLIMTSAVYVEDSQLDPAKAALDPAGKLFWRHPRRRLEAEAIRDALLAVGGTLDTTMFGPGFLDDNMRRRSIYFTVKRSKLVPMMVLFDAPDALSGIAARSSTTIAPQALLLLNNPLVRDAVGHFGKRIDLGGSSGGSDSDLAAVVHRGYRTALARWPDADELAEAVEFLKTQMAAYQADGKPNLRELALADFCQVLVALNEFVYVE